MKSKRSASARVKKNEPTLTPTEIYKLNAREIPWGIEGYEIPKKYFDYYYSVWHKRRGDILTGKEKRIWPPRDWPKDKNDETQKVPPKRKTYLDDLYKWCYSFYDPKRAEELISEKNININDYVKPIVKDEKRRKDFNDNEAKKAAWKKERDAFIPDHKVNGIEAVKEKIKVHEKEREIPYSVRMKRKYIKGKEQMPRCDRVTIVADAEFVGEQIPFYNTPPDENNTGKNKKLFWPDKFVTMKKYPVWRICEDSKKPENIATVEQNFKEKYNDYLSNKGITEKDLHLHLNDALYKVTHHGTVYLKWYKDTDFKNEDHYKAAMEDHPKVSPAPNHYFQIPKGAYAKRVNDVKLESIEDSNGNKVYYMDRRRTDKRVYSAGMRKAVY